MLIIWTIWSRSSEIFINPTWILHEHILCGTTWTMSTIGLKCGAFWPKGLTNSHLSRAYVPLVVTEPCAPSLHLPAFSLQKHIRSVALSIAMIKLHPHDFLLKLWSACAKSCTARTTKLSWKIALIRAKLDYYVLVCPSTSIITKGCMIHYSVLKIKDDHDVTMFARSCKIPSVFSFLQKLQLRHSAHSGNPQVRQLRRSSDEGKVINGSNGMPPAMWDEHKHPRPQSNIKALRTQTDRFSDWKHNSYHNNITNSIQNLLQVLETKNKRD